MNDKPHVLYAEDDQTLSFVTKDHLELNNYKVTHCSDGEEALNSFRNGSFDICVLDVMMPKMDGFTLAENIRKLNHQVPIIFLTAKSLKEDKIKGLTIGADDYITKPFSIEEIILKLEIFLKRKMVFQVKKDETIKIGDYIFDPTNFKITNDDFERGLTQRESELLQFLYLNANSISKRSDILMKIWGKDDYFLGRSLDVFISRLRKYLNKDERISIENIHGVGFRLVVPE